MPAYVEAYYNLGRALTRQGQTAAAITTYRKALHHRPNWSPAAHDLAWLLATQATLSRRDAAEALRLAEAVCRATNYTEARALHTLAVANAAAGRRAEAMHTAHQALAAAEAAGQTALASRIRMWQRRYEQESTHHAAP